MGIRLKILSLWVPNFVLKKGLDELAKKTIEGLQDLLNQYGIENLEKNPKINTILKGNINETRISMAIAHNNHVKALIDNLGHENAVKVGRIAMFNVGYKIGQRLRLILGVGEDIEDLEIVAKILYKILAIDFKLENKDGNYIMIVNRCFLSKYYSYVTCLILSAVDEGIVKGLNNNIKLKFEKRITEGESECIACINEEIL